MLSLPAFAFGWNDPHKLQEVDGGHPNAHVLGGKNECMLLQEMFAAH